MHNSTKLDIKSQPQTKHTYAEKRFWAIAIAFLKYYQKLEIFWKNHLKLFPKNGKI